MGWLELDGAVLDGEAGFGLDLDFCTWNRPWYSRCSSTNTCGEIMRPPRQWFPFVSIEPV